MCELKTKDCAIGFRAFNKIRNFSISVIASEVYSGPRLRCYYGLNLLSYTVEASNILYLVTVSNL